MAEDQPDEQQASRPAPDPLDSRSIPDMMQHIVKSLKEDQITEQDRAILSIFERALVASDRGTATEKQSETKTVAPATDAITPNTDKTDPCTAAAAEIDRLCPNPETLVDPPGVEVFLTALWWMLSLTVRTVPYNHQGQDTLVGVVEALRLRAKSTVQIWGVGILNTRDTRMHLQWHLMTGVFRERIVFGGISLYFSNTFARTGPVREHLHSSPAMVLKDKLMEFWRADPGICGEPSFYNDESVSEWVNLNTFVARLMGKGIVVDPIWAIPEIQRALEQEFPDTGLARQYTLRIASQYILLGGAQLLNAALKNDIFDEVDLRITHTGPLYAALGGKPGLGMNRWRFWLKRLEDLGWEGGEDETRPERLEARQASQRMKEITEQDSRVIARRLGTNEEGKKAAPAGEDSAPKDTENRE